MYYLFKIKNLTKLFLKCQSKIFGVITCFVCLYFYQSNVVFSVAYPYRVVHLPIDHGQVEALRIASDGQTEEDHLHDGQGEDEQHHADVAPHAQHVLGEQGADLALGGDPAQAGVAVLAALLVIGVVVAPRRRRAVRLLVELERARVRRGSQSQGEGAQRTV